MNTYYFVVVQLLVAFEADYVDEHHKEFGDFGSRLVERFESLDVLVGGQGFAEVAKVEMMYTPHKAEACFEEVVQDGTDWKDCTEAEFELVLE